MQILDGTLPVEYPERGKEYGILFIFSLFYEYIQLEYVRSHVIYRVHEAEYGIPVLVIAPQEYVNIYSTRRNGTHVNGALCASVTGLRLSYNQTDETLN